MGIMNLGYVILEMQDPEKWSKFSQDILGFGEAESFGEIGTKYLRMDNAPFRYMVRKGDKDRFLAGGYEISSKSDFEKQIELFEVSGIDVYRGTKDEADCRAVEAFVSVKDPSGNNVEIFYGRAPDKSFLPGHSIRKFITGAMGLGHMVLPAPENEATISFYEDLMGFGVSDDLTLPAFAPEMPEQRIYFMHSDNPRHHTLGLYNFPNPTGVIHLMAEMTSMDEVGHCLDRVKAAGLHIFASLGRHANDEMISFYFFAPGGIGFEVGYDGKQIGNWDVYEPTKSVIGDIWGHEYDFPVVG
ncbi:MAG: VOC family protein [Hellea sp.]|nr:VOC family protein [Hellea sp.]MDG2361401.1 VOC family protein [Hellea sp.]|tara:strand:+ start:6176 stop:7075 length:900 start_codon:yes stop_codon:yes gene_type:complete